MFTGNELPNKREDFTSQFFPASNSTGLEPLRGRHDGYSQAIEDTRDFPRTNITSYSWFGYALEICENGVSIISILNFHLDLRELTCGIYLVVPDVAFVFEDLCDCFLDFGMRGFECLVACA